MFSDDLWAMRRMQSHGDIEECTSFRVCLGDIVHRFVCADGRADVRWSSLCRLRPIRCPPAVDLPVNCLGCIAEGG